MNQSQPTPTEDELLEALAAALIRRCGLTDHDVARIVQSQKTLNVSFVDAALTLGYLTQEDVDYVRSNQRSIVVQRRTGKPCEAIVIARDPYDTHSELVRALRTELLLRSEAVAEANVIAVVSPDSGDGRSLLAAELAVAFAQLGQSTMLLDADLRHPRQHELFNVGVVDGFAQALMENRSLELAAISGIPQLSLLTAGHGVSNPLELLSDHRFEMLLNGWRRRYQHIVIDTPPISRYSDGLAIAMVAGRVLTISRAHHSTFSSTREMLKRLNTARASVVGAVMNRF